MAIITTIIIILSSTLLVSAQFIDEMQTYEKECIGEDKLACMSGGCVLHTQYCDGVLDCVDGTDENFCFDKHPNVELCNETHQFMCADQSKCIPNHWICNKELECSDGSDELNCTAQPDVIINATCKGFTCGDGRCISNLWVCDGVYDCEDKSDEYAQDLCRHTLVPHAIRDGLYCQELLTFGDRNYKCMDSSYCLPSAMMCNGMQDCRDGSDEGPFCNNWYTMCSTFECHGNDTQCSPERHGPTCICLPSHSMKQYNYTTHRCDDVNECLLERPQCSHICTNADGHFTCKCDVGYTRDEFGYLCYAPGPEALLFFSTNNDIRYLRIKSKQLVNVTTGIKDAHGVSYDGTYLYWVQTAQGHQTIVRAHLDDVEGTKEVLVGLGLEEPGDIAVDWLGGNIYFSDTQRGIISACHTDGSMCTTIHTNTKHPRFVTLDVRNGKMYWADWHYRPLIMTSAMDGTNSEILVDKLETFATGLAMDVPNGRLYYVDRTVKVLMIDGKRIYSLFEEPFHHPYSISVFENTVFWSDWTSNTIQTTDKLHGSAQKRNVLLTMDRPVYDMHIYHPILMNSSSNPCENSNCSHFCFITSNVTHVCGCPDGMELRTSVCILKEDYQPQHLIIGGGQLFTMVQYNTLGNPESHATHFDIGRVQAMAYDNVRDTLYIYDGQRKSINYIEMKSFTLGLTRILVYSGLEYVVDMDYDYVTDSLYILDAGHHSVEVLSLRTKQRALIYKFKTNEVPISFCLLPDYGRMLVAIAETEDSIRIHIDSIGLDGEGRHHLVMNNLKGPYIRLRYAQDMDNVYISDDGNGAIDYIHPEGTGRENFRKLSTTITSLAVTDSYVFWTDRRTSRLFWSDIHETTHKIRRIDLSLFPNNTQLLLKSTSPKPDAKSPLSTHPCLHDVCSDVCTQISHSPPHQATFHMGYKCHCPPGLLLNGVNCTKRVVCMENELYCHKSNVCIPKRAKCDFIKDCVHGEDEEGCTPDDFAKINCSPEEIMCNGLCLDKSRSFLCEKRTDADKEEAKLCSEIEYQCANSSICLARSQICDTKLDCPDGSDEDQGKCDTLTCMDTEFMCTSGNCILKSWKCDGDEDCMDASDETNCDHIQCGPGSYKCENRECIELHKRCDGHQDCFDSSDEKDCIIDYPNIIAFPDELPHCAEREYACELNRSICLPLTARCNMKVECPGGTDENGCDFHCSPHGMFACKQQLLCVPMPRVCNGRKDCVDGSDETPDACAIVNRTSHLFPPPLYPQSECVDGYLCHNGQCIEWREVCDKTENCFDGSDENGLCSTACHNSTCKFLCQPTPLGPHCRCPAGFKTDVDHHTCVDVDECVNEVCSQGCINVPGSFLCTCHHGYALRSNRRSCKAVRGNMSILYVSGNTVRSTSSDGTSAVEYSDPNVASITGLDINIRKNKLYVTSGNAMKLIEDNSTDNIISITNIGQPTRVAVDWVTDNVYFIDSTPSASCVRVCNVRMKRCAKLQNLPSDAQVSALIVEPRSRRMFYCVRRELESVVWSSSLAGQNVVDLTTVRNCTGLAVDSFAKKLYVAETGPAHIIRMNFEGEMHKKILADHPQLQAPHGLAIFEDSIYYIVANSFKLSHCRLFGQKHCETYMYRLFDANTFVIRHQSVQRDDLKNECEGFVCSNVCALDKDGPVCVCDDGALAKKGFCGLVKKNELPLFNGWTYQDFMSHHHVSFTVIIAVLALFVIYLGIFIYYHFVYKPMKNRPSAYSEVRFQNSSTDGASFVCSPSVDISAGGDAHEFSNPLQYVRNIWQQSFRKSNRPVCTEGLTINVPHMPPQDFSDTESDYDDRENKKLLISHKNFL